MGSFLDWRTVAISAIAGISVLLGVLNRWNDDRTADLLTKLADVQQTNERQWERITEMDARHIRDSGKVERLEQDIARNTQLLRELERAVIINEHYTPTKRR